MGPFSRGRIELSAHPIDAALRKLCACAVNGNFAKCVFSRIPSVRYGRSSKKTTKMNASSVPDTLSRLPECEAKRSVVDDELRTATGESGSVVRARYACGAAQRRETLASGER